MKLIFFVLVLSLSAYAQFGKDKVGADYVHQEDDASLSSSTLPQDKSELEKPAIQREEDREAAMPDEPTPTEDEQKEAIENEELP